MKKLVAEKEKILNNIDIIKEKAGCSIIAVLKANAYGMGLYEMASILRENGIRRFAVTEPDDAVKLRELGFADEEILILRSTACDEDIEKIISSGATATIGSYDAAVALNGLAEKEATICDVHIEVDTGMGRYGFAPGETEKIISVFRFMPNLNVTGMYTHFANAFKSAKKTREQYELFMDTATKIRAAGFDPGMLHADNSAALFGSDIPTLDAVRIGSAFSGRMTLKGDYGLKKTGKLQSEVIEIRWLGKKHGVGYGSAFVTRKPTRIAVIPVGTADGFMVEKSRDSFRFRDGLRYAASDMLSSLRKRRFYVYINGKKCRILGHVGLNHTVADITDIGCSIGDTALFDVQPMMVPASVAREYK